MSVPDIPEIVLPTNPVVEEDGVLVVSGLGMYDADVSRPGDEELLFDVWLEVVSGRLSVNRSTVRLPEIQTWAGEIAIYGVRNTTLLRIPLIRGYGLMFQLLVINLWRSVRNRGCKPVFDNSYQVVGMVTNMKVAACELPDLHLN